MMFLATDLGGIVLIGLNLKISDGTKSQNTSQV